MGETSGFTRDGVVAVVASQKMNASTDGHTYKILRISSFLTYQECRAEAVLSEIPSHMSPSPAFPDCGYREPQDLRKVVCTGVSEWIHKPEWALDCIYSSPMTCHNPVGTVLDPCHQPLCLRQVTWIVFPWRFISMNSKSTVPSYWLRNPIRIDSVPKRSFKNSLNGAWKHTAKLLDTTPEAQLQIMRPFMGLKSSNDPSEVVQRINRFLSR